LAMKALEAVNEKVSQVIVGYSEIVEDMLTALVAGGHVIIEGVPGIAKTTLAKTFARVTGLKFCRVQFTQDLLPADITGHYYFNYETNQFEFREGPIFTNVLLADEINRAPTKTQSALLEAMEEGQVTVEGSTFPLPRPFFVIATINPIEHEGVYTLPEAQLDRFMFKLKMGYLPREVELAMLKLKNQKYRFYEVDPLEEGFLKSLREAFLKVYADEEILRYIGDLVRATRERDEVLYGASPRAAEQILYASKARAAVQGRDFVLPDDVKDVAVKALRHRLILSVEAEMSGVTPERVIEDVLRSIPPVTGGSQKQAGRK